jgi:hypothetical protein
VSDPHRFESAMARVAAQLEDGGEPDPASLDEVLVTLGVLMLEGSVDGLQHTVDRIAPWFERHGAATSAAAMSAFDQALATHEVLLDSTATAADALVESRTALEARRVVLDALGSTLDPERALRLESRDEELGRRVQP